MAYLRFKIKFDEWRENGLFVFTTIEDGDDFPFVENDLISAVLQFITIEVGPFVYEREISEAIWIAELIPDVEEVETTWFEGSFDAGMFIEHSAPRFLTKVIRLADNSTHTLEVDIDKDNKLVAHLIEEDGPEFPFNMTQKITMPMRVTNVKHNPHGESYKSFPLWTALLVPEGKMVGDTITSEVKHKN